MNVRQTLVIVGCVITGIVLWVLPRTALSAKPKTQENPQIEQAVSEQVELLKKELNQADLVKIEFYEQRLQNAGSKADKVSWYDSLAASWDQQMRPGIAAEYVYYRAALTGESNDWLRAGKRFLGLSGFFSPEEREMLISRAVECLEKAYATDSLNPEVQTNLGVAYTQSGSNPMKGIGMLRQVVEKNPGNFDAQFNLGVFSMQSGQYDKAIGRFRTAVQLRNDLPEIRLYLSDALSGAGMKPEARKELLELKKLTRDTVLLKEVDRRLQQIP
jgi:tetratricopeptide (TPR) repeat protein